VGRKLCLAIGVSDAPPLDFLPGASNGARSIGAWAKEHGYETRVLTDDEKPLNTEDIASALQEMLAGPDGVERLIVYFAGHGVSRDADEDLWLPSQWRDKQRAIAVAGLRRKLERFGIVQLAIISDACRNAPTEDWAADLTADKLLGLGPYDPAVPQADILKASAKFASAFMIPGETTDADCCIFSGVLEDALWGFEEEAFAKSRAVPCITSQSLAGFLEQAVPKRAAVYGVTLKPDITPGFRETTGDLYLDGRPMRTPKRRNWPQNTSAAGAMGVSAVRRPESRRAWSTPSEAPLRTRSWSKPLFEKSYGAPTQSKDGSLDGQPDKSISFENDIRKDQVTAAERDAVRERTESELRAAYQTEVRPTHFESGVGLALSGTHGTRIVLSPPAFAQEDESRSGAWWRVLPYDPSPLNWDGTRLRHPVSALVQCENGIWLGAAALPDFVVSISANDDGAQSVIYRSMMMGGYAPDAEAAVAALRAGSLTSEAAIDWAIRLRQGKHADPMLGVIAAYLYDARGDIESIRQIAWFHAQRNQPIAFDLALLGRLPVRQYANGRLLATVPAIKGRSARTKLEADLGWTTRATPEDTAPVAGQFPWLRQGWLLVEDDAEGLCMPGLSDIGKNLLKAPFTSLPRRGGEMLARLITRGG